MKVFLQTKCYKIEIIYHICVWGLSIFFKSMKNLKNVKFEWEDVAFAFLYKILLLYIFVLKQPPSIGMSSTGRYSYIQNFTESQSRSNQEHTNGIIPMG